MDELLHVRPCRIIDEAGCRSLVACLFPSVVRDPRCLRQLVDNGQQNGQWRSQGNRNSIMVSEWKAEYVDYGGCSSWCLFRRS